MDDPLETRFASFHTRYRAEFRRCWSNATGIRPELRHKIRSWAAAF